MEERQNNIKPRSIHILALDTTRKGGAGVYTAALVRNLVLSGHKVTLICHEATDDIKAICRVLEIPRPVKGRGFGLWRFDALLQIRDYKRALKRLDLQPADVTFGSVQPMIMPYVQLLPTSKLIYLPHSMIAPLELASYGYGDVIQRKVMIWAYEFMERFCLKRAITTIRFSQETADAFIKYYGKEICDSFNILPMPVDSPSISTKKTKNDRLNLLSVGRLIPSKNIDFLLQSLSNFRSLSWHLDIVGDGPEKPNLIALTEKLALLNKVSFHGQIENLAQFYQKANLFLFPSLLENYAIVLVESMSYATPALAFQPDGNKYINVNDKIINNNVDGLLATDNADFSEILKKCINGEFNLSELGIESESIIRTRNSWKSHIDSINIILNTVV